MASFLAEMSKPFFFIVPSKGCTLGVAGMYKEHID
jgi:hypothetical protein